MPPAANPFGMSTVEACSVLDWYATMPDPLVATPPLGRGQLIVRRYAGTPSEMNQPSLFENVICMHLGGGKEVRRWQNGRMDVHNVELGALTIMPAYRSNRWLTRGPVNFAHVALDQKLVAQIAQEEFNADSAKCMLIDRVGFRDAYLESLFTALLDAVQGRALTGRLYPESLMVVLVTALLEQHSSLSSPSVMPLMTGQLSRGGLTPSRLRRIVDHMQDHLKSDIALGELTALVGLSRAQFFRAFKQTTGATPHRYLTDLRLDSAKAMLEGRDVMIDDVGAAVGMPNRTHFTALFRRRFGLTPRAYKASRQTW